jgi:hypothetical protein
MNHRNAVGWTVLALALVAGACARQEAPAPEPQAPALEPGAQARLRAMSQTLAGAQAFSFATRERRERLDAAGNLVAREFSQEVTVARPDRVHLTRTGADVAVTAVYDGKTFSLKGDREKVWAQVEAPPTIDEAMDYLAEVYRLPMPIADILYSDPYASIVADDTAARVVGKESIDGTACDYVRIETPAVHADLWIEEGARALPRKLELVHTALEGAPRTSIVFSDWDLATASAPGLFTFTPPEGYERIRMVAVMSPEEEELVRTAPAEGEAEEAGMPPEPAPQPAQ